MYWLTAEQSTRSKYDKKYKQDILINHILASSTYGTDGVQVTSGKCLLFFKVVETCKVTGLFMFKVNKQCVPAKILNLFEIKVNKDDFQGKVMYKNKMVRTNAMKNGIFVQVVNMWNLLCDDLKNANFIYQFKKMYIFKIYQKYLLDWETHVVVKSFWKGFLFFLLF